jgi:cilia- and flagella-associated protein 65
MGDEGPEMLSREDRVLKFGVDCVGPHESDGICFAGGEWVPGGEYIKKLRVKNVSTRCVKLKYRLPVTRYGRCMTNSRSHHAHDLTSLIFP